jgi:signal transduction histidine kinase
MTLLSCPDSIPNLLGLVDTSIAPRLLYYSYLPVLVLALFVGFLVYFKDRKALQSKLFLGINLSFSIWILLILLQWIGVHVQTVQLAWQLLAMFEALVFLCSIYFVYVFLFKKDVSFLTKQIFFVLLAALVVVIPSKFNIAYFDFDNCEGAVGPLWNIIYGLEILTILGVVALGIKALKSKNRVRSKKEVTLLTIGISAFLLLFSGTNILGELLQNYQVNLFGSIGVAIFVGILGYMVVRYNAFNFRVLGAQVLVFALGFLVFAMIFIRTISSVQVIAVFTLIGIIFIGRSLIRGVRLEVLQRQNLEKLTIQLESANEKLKGLDKLKTEFLSLASHQLRSPLTAIKGYASMLDEGSLGTMTPEQGTAAKRIYASAQGLVNLVEDLLNVSKIEQGGMKYEMMPVELAKIVTDLAGEMKIPAENKGLELRVAVPQDDAFKVSADPVKIKQVFLNLVDNSIKYTTSGFVEVGLKRGSKNDVLFTVRDSGVGITPETKAKLFQKFSRGGEGSKMNTGGSGLGLYLAQEIARAHKGDIIVDSEGLGKGTTFTVSLPAA